MAISSVHNTVAYLPLASPRNAVGDNDSSQSVGDKSQRSRAQPSREAEDTLQSQAAPANLKTGETGSGRAGEAQTEDLIAVDVSTALQAAPAFTQSLQRIEPFANSLRAAIGLYTSAQNIVVDTSGASTNQAVVGVDIFV